MELSSTVKSSDLPYPRKQGFEITPTIRMIFIVVIIVATCSTITTTIYDCFTKWLRRLLYFNFYKIKCDRCQYLDCNPHLKCAVHPSIVLTHQAIDCKDYKLCIEQELHGELPRLIQFIKNFILKSTY